MSVMASPITGNSTFFYSLFKRNIKTLYYRHFVNAIHRWSVVSLTEDWYAESVPVSWRLHVWLFPLTIPSLNNALCSRWPFRMHFLEWKYSYFDFVFQHLSLLSIVQLIISLHWFRWWLCAGQAINEPMIIKGYDVYRRQEASLFYVLFNLMLSRYIH